MSTISIATANQFNNADILDGIQPSSLKLDQFRQLLPCLRIHGPEVRLNTAVASSIETFATHVSSTGVAVTSGLPAFGTRTGKLAHYAAILEMDSIVPQKYGSRNRLLHHLIKLKVLAVLSAWQKHLVTGDSASTGQFDGLRKIAENGGNAFAAATWGGDANKVNKGDLERLVGRLPSRSSADSRYLVMHASVLGHLAANHYSTQIRNRSHPLLGMVPVISGIPVLLDSWIPTNEGAGADETAVFAVSIGPPVGVVGLLPWAQARREVRVSRSDPQEGTDKDFYHITLDAGQFAFEQNAVVALTNVKANT